MKDDDLEKAISILKEQNLSFVAINGENVIQSNENGVKPLLKLINEGIDLSEFAVADKVTGKAAALLGKKLNIVRLHTILLGEKAIPFLEKFGVKYEYEIKVGAILNRAKNGLCPMELAVKDIENEEAALAAIKNKILEMNKEKK